VQRRMSSLSLRWNTFPRWFVFLVSSRWPQRSLNPGVSNSLAAEKPCPYRAFFCFSQTPRSCTRPFPPGYCNHLPFFPPTFFESLLTAFHWIRCFFPLFCSLRFQTLYGARRIFFACPRPRRGLLVFLLIFRVPGCHPLVLLAPPSAPPPFFSSPPPPSSLSGVRRSPVCRLHGPPIVCFIFFFAARGLCTRLLPPPPPPPQQPSGIFYVPQRPHRNALYSPSTTLCGFPPRSPPCRGLD